MPAGVSVSQPLFGFLSRSSKPAAHPPSLASVVTSLVGESFVTTSFVDVSGTPLSSGVSFPTQAPTPITEDMIANNPKLVRRRMPAPYFVEMYMLLPTLRKLESISLHPSFDTQVRSSLTPSGPATSLTTCKFVNGEVVFARDAIQTL